MTTETLPRRPSEARDRLLRTASAIFYAKGVHSVGIDEIVSEAQVTRATFYRHFPSKDSLIVAYLQAADEQIRTNVQGLIDNSARPSDALRAIAASIVQQIHSAEFRGCAFLNAAAEYPDVENPIHQAVQDHRAWFLATLTDQFRRAFRAEHVSTRKAEPAAKFYVMIRDGAMAAGCLSDPDVVSQVFQRGVEGILSFHQLP